MNLRRVFFSLAMCLLVDAGAAAQPARQGGAMPEASAIHLNVGPVDTRGLVNIKTRLPAAFDVSRPYVVQLSGPMTPAVRQQIAQAGIRLGEYLPNHAYVADLGGANPRAIDGIQAVNWIGEFQNAWKLDPQIGRVAWQTVERQAMAQRGQTAAIITLFAGRNPGTAARAVMAIDRAVIHYIETIGDHVEISATLPLARLAGLAELADVHYLEEAPELTLRNSTTRWIVQSNVTNVTPLYDNGIRGAGQIVGIMDGKINVTHCSFSDVNPIGPTHRKILAYNTSQGSDTHGTHVAGTAVGDNGVNDNTRGIAYQGKLVFDDIPSFSDTAMYNNLLQHHNQGARVHTNSWGNDGTTSYDSLCRGIDRFSYDFEESLVLFAVTNTSSLKNPENAKNLLAVGASQDTPNQANHCSGGAGPTADLRRKPEIYAPGCNTNSSSAGTACGTTALTGTSMASPAVAGTAMLVRQYYTDGYYPSGVASAFDALSPSAALVKATMLNASVDMTGISGYPSNQEGWGRVLADNALYFPGNTRKLAVLEDIRNADGLGTADPPIEYNLNVLGSAEQLRVTLVWTDPPAAASTGTGAAAINNLDLEVVAPNSTLYRGNVFSGGVSISGGTADPRNNVEQVHLNSPAVGSWTVRVRPTAVNQGSQGYALVATGDVLLSPPDCNSNGTPDDEDIAMGESDDCNENGRPDECESQADCNANSMLDICDLFDGTSLDCNDDDTPDECQLSGNDCNTNGTPDDCEPDDDCNENGTADICDVASGSVPDCNTNGIPDECELSGTTILLNADFEGGLPAGWSASALWHVTSACPRSNSCNPIRWAYYGQDGTCTFNAGNTSGAITAPAVTIPAFSSSVTLTYCSAYGGEAGNSNQSDWDWAWVSANGVEVDDVSLGGDQATWETRTVNLTSLAGQTVTLRFNFDTIDNLFNSELGWQIDQVHLEAVVVGSEDCNANATPDECDVAAGTSPDCNADQVPDECQAPVPCPCEGLLGDMDANGLRDGEDLHLFIPCYLGGDPDVAGCGCADMNTNGGFSMIDINMLVNCLVGLGCP